MLVSFDCYGTIIDWERGILESLGKLLREKGIRISDSEILKMYAEIEPELEREYKPYKDVLRGVVKEFAKRLGFTLKSGEENVLVDTIGQWPAFEDSRKALEMVKEHAKIAVISNVDDDLIEKTLENLGLDFDYVITAQMVRAYKPSKTVFEAAQKITRIGRNEWIHVGQSVFHDIIPAKELGIKTVLIKRRGYGATPEVRGEADKVFEDLLSFAEWFTRLQPQG